MPGAIQDQYGMTLSTNSPLAGQRWGEAIDLLLSQNAGPEAKFREALALDEGFAVAHAGLAFLMQQRARPEEAQASARQAVSLSDGITRRERQQIQAIAHWVQGRGRDSIAQIKEHVAEFPRDALLLRLAHRLYMRGCSGAGEANFPPAYLALLQSIEPQCRDDWAFLAEYAFAHHETGLLAESLRLAERSLELNPTNAVACHSATHVYFERGDASSGEDFLGGWLAGFDAPATSYVHLSWHLALFELAQGKYRQTLDRYENYIRPSVLAQSRATLNDSASLLWRLQVYSGMPPPAPWPEVVTLAAPATERPGDAFRDAHAALAFAGSGDHDSMRRMLDRLGRAAKDGDSFIREVVLPLAQGIDAFAQGNYARAVELFEPVAPQLTRIGGSHAQREVFEDTFLESYIRAERFDRAEDLLRSRLGQRESVRDTFWLGRVQAGRGELAPARYSLDRAAQEWQSADPDFPELESLNQLAATLG
jgi:tetratricopeptide (TPR) repeat protein